MKKGICCAGNMLVDITYPIETWPKQNELTHITEGIESSTGGCNLRQLVMEAENKSTQVCARLFNETNTPPEWRGVLPTCQRISYVIQSA